MTSPAHLLDEAIALEGDDTLHEFGGSHGNKGNDFAIYWSITRLVELEQEGAQDYLLLGEYLQDVAEFDSPKNPTKASLYQLKKKEPGSWDPLTLTGQTKRSKAPNDQKPIPKLIRHVRSFKSTPVQGAFVSNAPFDVPLATGQSSSNETRIGLHLLDDEHTAGLKKAIAVKEGILENDVDLSRVELRCVPLAINDLQNHTNGIVLAWLEKMLPDQAGLASSVVDSLFSRLKRTARRTNKCADWSMLVAERGFARSDFVDAIEKVKHTPDKVLLRNRLLEKIAQQCDWSHLLYTKVVVSLTDYARCKVIAGSASRWDVDTAAVAKICNELNKKAAPDREVFEKVAQLLQAHMPDLSPHETYALSLYEVVEWNLSQIHV